MIGIVLAAGAGRRLRPYTDHLPKALVPVGTDPAGEVTILDIALRNLAEVGITEVAIVVGYAAEAVTARADALAARYQLRLDLIHNDRAEEWNNAYSLWLARDRFAAGAMLVNGDTVHPVSVEKTLLGSVPAGATEPGVLLAVDDLKSLATEEMKVDFDADGRLRRIHKSLDPATAHGEYIGVCRLAPAAADGLAEALEATWRRDPNLYYEDGFQVYADRGGEVRGAPIGPVDWVEVDNHADLAQARDIRADLTGRANDHAGPPAQSRGVHSDPAVRDRDTAGRR